MKFIKLLTVIFLVVMFIFSCKPSPKNITLEDFLTIQNEILKTDLTPESMEKVVKKYGYTVEQYEQFDGKVKTDTKLQEKWGEIRLKMGKSKSDLK